MHPVIWLYLPLIIGAAAIGGIVYLQRTGRAGKHQWAEKDTDATVGCIPSIIVAIPYLCVQYFAITFTFDSIVPRLPKQIGPYLGMIIAIALMVFGAYMVLPLDIALRSWGPWRWLHYWAARYNRHGQPESTNYKFAFIHKAKSFLRKYTNIKNSP